MPDLPKKKVGIVACSGEDIAEGTVTRLAALRVLEELRPELTVTICLPLFLAGGEGDRAFARFYPTIAIDGCEKRCAAQATERYSGKPAAEVVVTEVATEHDLAPVEGRRTLNEPGRRAVGLVAERVAGEVDLLLKVHWDRSAGEARPAAGSRSASSPEGARCSCTGSLPAQDVTVEGEQVKMVALPLLLDQFRLAGRPAGLESARDLLREVSVYNDLPPDLEEAYVLALERAFAAFLSGEG